MRSIHGNLGFAVSLVLCLSSWAFALQITGLRNPAGFLVDPTTNTYYLANENGGPTDHDNNGFITTLSTDGKIIKLKFIEGGRDGVRLDSPKGLAIVDNTLYVSDIEAIRGFDRISGRPTTDIDLSKFHIDFLTGIATDGQGMLYIADSGTDTIYKVDARHAGKPTVFVKDAALAGPHGLAVHPTTGHIISVSWNEGKIVDVAPNGTITVLHSNSFFNARFGNLTGVDFDADGNMYVADYSQGKIVRIDPKFHMQTIAEFLTTPGGLAIDRKNYVILVSYLSGNVAEINGLGRDHK